MKWCSGAALFVAPLPRHQSPLVMDKKIIVSGRFLDYMVAIGFGTRVEKICDVNPDEYLGIWDLSDLKSQYLLRRKAWIRMSPTKLLSVENNDMNVRLPERSIWKTRDNHLKINVVERYSRPFKIGTSRIKHKHEHAYMHSDSVDCTQHKKKKKKKKLVIVQDWPR